MKIKIKYNHPDFSYLIYKHPDNIFERKVNNLFDVIANFDYNNDYIIKTKPNYDNFLKRCRELNLDSYLINEHFIISPLNIEVFNIVFRSAIRGKFKDVDYKYTKHKYEIEIKPVYIYDLELFKKLFLSYFDFVTVIINYEFIGNKSCVGRVILEGTDRLDYLLQKLYILFYVYTTHNKYKIQLPNRDKLNKYIKFTKGWLNENDEFYNLITGRLGQNRFGKEILREKTENHSSVYINRKFGDDRYHVISNLLDENSSVLDLGCGNGRLIYFLFKNKIKIQSYYGVDRSIRNIDNAIDKYKKYRKFKFYIGNILYPDNVWFERTNTIILSDVLEHLKRLDRYRIIKYLTTLNDKRIIISVPNGSVNKIYWPEMNTEYRHKDHKIEYDLMSLEKEIIEPFSKTGRVINKICATDEFICFNDQITYILEII